MGGISFFCCFVPCIDRDLAIFRSRFSFRRWSLGLGLTHLEFSSFGLIWWAEISIWKLHSSLFSWASGRICRVSWVDLRSITARIRGGTALCEAKEGKVWILMDFDALVEVGVHV